MFFSKNYYFKQSIDYCLTRLSSIWFFFYWPSFGWQINPTIKCSLRSSVHMQFNHWVPRCLASINHCLQSILTRPLSSTNNRAEQKKSQFILVIVYSSEIRGLCLLKWLGETFQILRYSIIIRNTNPKFKNW